MRTKALTLVLLLIAGTSCLAQDSIPPEIRVDDRGDSLHFSARLRALRQIAGAPAAFYTYFWELGDGHFSFDKDPVYAYRDTGEYQVRFYATNNYDDGKAPPTRPRPVKVKKKIAGADGWASHFFRGRGGIEMKINRYPKPGEDFVTIVGYRNRNGAPFSGSVVLFYNERQIGRDGFALAEQRCYNKESNGSLDELMARLETPVIKGRASLWGEAGADRGNDEPGVDEAASSMLHQLEEEYTKHTVLHFAAMKPGEERFVFLDMNTLPGMLQDTNATVDFTAMLVPDDRALAPEQFQMDMQIVASHDPNRMRLVGRRINYRFMRKDKQLTYRVEWQNTGKGPTRKISVGVAIPRQLDPGSLQVKAISPACVWCDSAYNRQSCFDTVRRGDSIYFVFNNIYLPGLEQEGVKDQDSTTGSIEYTVRFKKKPKKIPFASQANIVFDRNPPVTTNRAMARFIKGISPGIMVGYSALPSNGAYSARGPLQFGYVLAPYKPYRPYFQAEVFVGLLHQNDFTGTVVKDNSDTLIGGLPVLITGRQTVTTTRRNSFEITPLHYRYNINNWLGVGLGAMAQVNISEQTTVENKVYFVSKALPLNTMISNTSQKSSVTWLGNWNAAPFADLQIGRVRTGPVLGIRYIRLLKGDITDRFFLYAGFKL
jgi:PKD repeat protein